MWDVGWQEQWPLKLVIHRLTLHAAPQSQRTSTGFVADGIGASSLEQMPTAMMNFPYVADEFPLSAHQT